eukprot:CAMPEP_0174379160 /NCGR_PEP_ID=MMETSP0811_2-20130205/122526_1 /TAXON_ID=73025 ORGANISM="Eutreptiella gymnastica-like, Strain CCMP1594" /NCGR_SAMPLE_ID=MMETSP0811_2 /ASSEMBLY_ACC=CAM_ASM_000667 /LENGTH=78 /DNA_ID=CAMNT_0015531605 /DNA_START=2789 /DNA_END=3022 /DNA_ORIENTATION=+
MAYIAESIVSRPFMVVWGDHQCGSPVGVNVPKHQQMALKQLNVMQRVHDIAMLTGSRVLLTEHIETTKLFDEMWHRKR